MKYKNMKFSLKHTYYKKLIERKIYTMPKKSFTLFFLLISLLLQASFPAMAYNIGDLIGHALTTDIVATINGYDIPSYNVNGHTYIVAEDLKYYGFTVWYDDTIRSLFIERDTTQSWVSKSYTKPNVTTSQIGKKAHKLLYTDIRTYIGKSSIPGYNIDGQTIIRFDSLSAFGGVTYDNSKREISLSLSGLNYNPNPINRKTTSNINQYTSSTYPGTTLPTYTSVTGVRLKEERESSDGDSIYVYTYTGSNDVSQYWKKLLSLGWAPFQEDSSYTSDIYESSFYKGDRFVIINVYFEINEIWITY